MNTTYDRHNHYNPKLYKIIKIYLIRVYIKTWIQIIPIC